MDYNHELGTGHCYSTNAEDTCRKFEDSGSYELPPGASESILGKIVWDEFLGKNPEKIPCCMKCGRPYDEPQGFCEDCGGSSEAVVESVVEPGYIIELCGYCLEVFLDYGTWKEVE